MLRLALGWETYDPTSAEGHFVGTTVLRCGRHDDSRVGIVSLVHPFDGAFAFTSTIWVWDGGCGDQKCIADQRYRNQTMDDTAVGFSYDGSWTSLTSSGTNGQVSNQTLVDDLGGNMPAFLNSTVSATTAKDAGVTVSFKGESWATTPDAPLFAPCSCHNSWQRCNTNVYRQRRIPLRHVGTTRRPSKSRSGRDLNTDDQHDGVSLLAEFEGKADSRTHGKLSPLCCTLRLGWTRLNSMR